MILIKQFHPAVIFGTLTIAFFGSYACITLYEQYRLCSKVNKTKLMHPMVLLFFMAVSIGGVAIWCMHFVAMSGVSFYTPDNRTRVYVRYRIDLTIVSLIAVILVAFAGLYVCTVDKAFIQDQSDVVDDYVHKLRQRNISQLRKIDSKNLVLAKALSKNMKTLAIGGVCVAGGVCVMHYIGMQAMVFDGYIRWNYGIVTASVLIALVAGSAALWILFRLLAVFPEMELLRFASAVIMAAAVNGMHYTGMAAGDFIYDPFHTHSSYTTVDQVSAVTGALIAAVISLWIFFIIASSDLRTWYYHLSFIIHEADIRAQFYKKTGNTIEPFLEDYMVLRDIEYNGSVSRHKVRQNLHKTPGKDEESNDAIASKMQLMSRISLSGAEVYPEIDANLKFNNPASTSGKPDIPPKPIISRLSSGHNNAPYSELADEV